MLMDIVIMMLAGIHFGVPLIYYLYLKYKWLTKPWNIKIDPEYRPEVSVIIPCFNEAQLIEKSLNSLVKQNYSKELEIIVVDDGSEDETSLVVKKWAESLPKVNLKLIEVPKNEGKLHALNLALKHIKPTSEIVVFTDADSALDEKAIMGLTGYFADPKVGVITGSINYIGNEIKWEENAYRNYYNILRIAESKRYSTPVNNGPLQAFRTVLLQRLGLPNFPGSDDCAFGSFIAFAGYRSIQVENATVNEFMRGSQVRRKIRRARLVLQSFMNTKRCAIQQGFYVNSPFDRTWKVEWWLWVVNPWLIVMCIPLLVIGAAGGSIVSISILGIGSMLLVVREYRMWLLQQIYLVIAFINNIFVKRIPWSR